MDRHLRHQIRVPKLAMATTRGLAAAGTVAARRAGSATPPSLFALELLPRIPEEVLLGFLPSLVISSRMEHGSVLSFYDFKRFDQP
jgi:hypothetical protein